MSGIALGPVLDALLDAYTAVVPAGFTVIDGEPVDPPQKFLCVGWIGPGEPSVSGLPSGLDLGSTAYDDRLQIGCLLSYWDGAEDLTLRDVRDAAVAAFSTFDAGLAADRLLGGVCMEPAYASAYEYVPDTNREGILVELRWTVSAHAQA